MIVIAMGQIMFFCDAGSVCRQEFILGQSGVLGLLGR
jgi:hypothetical protein